jgi:filamentous hemagglutinin family protein
MRVVPTPIRRAVVVLVATSIAAQGPLAFALPRNGNVAAGAATITSSGSAMRIEQATPRAITNWLSFDIGKGESVRIVQPSAQAALLARVTGGLGPSSLAGTLEANGQFFLINPQGVIVGRDAVIDTGAFLATSLDVTDLNFMAGGPLLFQGGGDGDIVNLGRITAANGSVTLVGRSVRNEGAIAAAQGSATLAAGTEYLMASADQPGLLVKGVAADAGGTAVDNQGVIEAASVRLEAAAGHLYALAINQAGVVRARGTSVVDGRVVLTAEGGTVDVSGTVSASRADGSGGDIHVGGGPRGGDASIANAARTQVGASAVLDASAQAGQGDGGQVTVWADRTAVLEGRVRADAGASGGDGGLVEVSAPSLRFKPAAPVSLAAPKGRAGTLLLDPDGWIVGTEDGVNQSSAATLQAQLGAGNVVIDTSVNAGDIDFNAAVAWSSGHKLTARSGNNINVNADIDGGSSGTVALYAGIKSFPDSQQGAPVQGDTRIDESATIRAGKLTVGGNTQWAVPGYTAIGTPGPGFVNAGGKLDVDTLELDTAAGKVGIIAVNAANRIGAVRTAGDGGLDLVDVATGSGPMNAQLAGTATRVQLAAPGDLTLESGTALTLGADGQAVLASTAGNFINDAGASAIAGGSFLVYSGSAEATVKGGLTAAEEFSRSYSGNPPWEFTDGVSRFLYRSSGAGLPQLTYRADDKTRLYGDANPTLTYSISDGSGPVAESSLSGLVTGAPLLQTAAVPASSAQTYVITITQGTLASTAYTFHFANGTLTVNPAPLTIAAQPASRFYGDANPAFRADVSGLKNSDTAAGVLANILLASEADRQSNVGSYPITVSALAGHPNYTYHFTGSTLTVRPAPVVLSLPEQVRAYGDPNPDLLLHIVPTGLKNLQGVSDAFPSLVLSTAAAAASPVGTYPVTGSGATNPNYAVTLQLQPLRVAPATLTVQAHSGTRMYGDANPTLGATVTGFKNGEDEQIVTGLQVATPAVATSPVGNYRVVASGAAAPNYVFVFLDGNLGVTAAPLLVAIDSKSRAFGDANPPLTYSVTGLRNGDTAAPFSLTTAASALSPVGSYAIEGSGSMANYTVSFTPGTMSVVKRPVTLAANDATRTYGANNPALGFSSAGLLPADEIYRNYWRAVTGATMFSNAGSYPITMELNPEAAPLATLFTNLPNYDVQFAPGTLSVTKAPLRLQADAVSAMWGQGRPPLTYTATGFMPWDSPSVLTGVQLTAAPDLPPGPGGVITIPFVNPRAPEPTPGSYPITFRSTGTAQNYEATVVIGSTFTVTPRPLVVTVPDVTLRPDQLKDYVYPVNIAPELYTNGPQFKIGVLTDAPPYAQGGTYNLFPVISGLTDDLSRIIAAHYLVQFNPGKVNVIPGPVILLNTTLTPYQPPTNLNENLLTLDLSTKITVLPTGPFGVEDIRNLLLENGSDLTEQLRKFIYAPDNGHNNGYGDGFLALPKDQQEALLNLLYGARSGTGMTWAAAAGQFSTNATLRAALAPILTSYAMTLIGRDTPLTSSQERLVSEITTSFNTQRAQLVAAAEAKYEAWAAQQSSRGLLNLLSSNLPDFVGSARQSVTTEVFKALGIATASAAAGMVAGAVFTSASVLNTVFPWTGVLTATGPVAVAVGAAVMVGAIAADQAVRSEANTKAFNALIASKGQPVSSVRDVDLGSAANKFDLFTAIASVLGRAY